MYSLPAITPPKPVYHKHTNSHIGRVTHAGLAANEPEIVNSRRVINPSSRIRYGKPKIPRRSLFHREPAQTLLKYSRISASRRRLTKSLSIFHEYPALGVHSDADTPAELGSFNQTGLLRSIWSMNHRATWLMPIATNGIIGAKGSYEGTAERQ